jgi:hypothetical protein
MIMMLVAAPHEAESRTPTGASERGTNNGRESLLKTAGAASSFALDSAASIGSKWGIVTSTRRTREHNRLVGGALNSFHLRGRAIDIARRPGVRHADIEASYRHAGFVLVESLDEGDHSHFAFGATGSDAAIARGQRPSKALARRGSGTDDCGAIVATFNEAIQRRRPDRIGECARPGSSIEARSVAAEEPVETD